MNGLCCNITRLPLCFTFFYPERFYLFSSTFYTVGVNKGVKIRAEDEAPLPAIIFHPGGLSPNGPQMLLHFTLGLPFPRFGAAISK